jgi:hypothetical protein
MASGDSFIQVEVREHQILAGRSLGLINEAQFLPSASYPLARIRSISSFSEELPAEVPKTGLICFLSLECKLAEPIETKFIRLTVRL